MNIQHYQQPVMKGQKIQAQSFNQQLETLGEVADNLNIELERAQSGLNPIDKRNWFKFRPSYEWRLNGQTNHYELKLVKLEIEATYIQDGVVGDEGEPVMIPIQKQTYDRTSLELLPSDVDYHVFLLLKKKTSNGIIYDFFSPEMDQLDEDEKVEKAWTLCHFIADIQNDKLYITESFIDGIDFFNGGEDAEPYGVFRWQGNTGQTEGEHPQPTGTVTQCNFLFGRSPVHLDDIEGIEDGEWWLEVDHDAPGSAFLTDSPEGNTPDKTYVPIFTISNQKVTKDWRGAVTIPVWEPSTYDGGTT